MLTIDCFYKAGLTGHIMKLLDLVKEAAPLLGSALGGPAGGLVGELISVLVPGSKSDSEVVAGLQSIPDYKLKLMQIQDEHESSLKAIASQNYAKEVEDRESARANNKDWVLHVLAIIFCMPYVGIEIFVALRQIQVDANNLRDLFSLAMLVASFYFGSSYGAQKK